jgi:hypothetical protein
MDALDMIGNFGPGNDNIQNLQGVCFNRFIDFTPDF